MKSAVQILNSSAGSRVDNGKSNVILHITQNLYIDSIDLSRYWP